jgi:hypothetical protein
MIAMMLFTFAVMSAFMIDYGYMQLVRGQTRMVADAAARAGAEALARTRNEQQARLAAMDIAGQNDVAGQRFVLDPGDVIFGQSVPQSDGTWTFNANVQPYNSVRVTPRVRNDSPFGAAPLFFGGVTGVDKFQTKSQATAGEQPVEICLCIDRSASMVQSMLRTFTTTTQFPANNPLLNPAAWYTSLRERHFHSPPHPTARRWAELRSALNIFLTECGKAVNPPRVALVTFSSATTLTSRPFTTCNTVDVDVPFPTSTTTTWTTTLNAITNSLNARSANPLPGGTRTSEGLQAAINQFQGSSSLVQSRKVIILFTDGQHDSGYSPVNAGANAAAAGITVHCVSLLVSFQSALSQVASMTGGKYYLAGENPVELQNAFRDLANQTPIVLME